MGIFRKALLTISAVVLTSCGLGAGFAGKRNEVSDWMSDNSKLRVCATNPIVADNVRRIGKEYVSVISLIEGHLDPHSYQIVKGDYEKLSNAKIVFANGLSLEHSTSLQRVLDQIKNVVYLSSAIPEEEIIIVNGSKDPHIWMDMALWAKTTEVVEEALVKADPAHESEYRSNARETRKIYLKNNKEIKQSLQTIPENKRYLVTSHDAFNYYGRAYLGVDGKCDDCVIAIQGLAPDEQISSAEIRRVVDYIRKHNVKVIFSERNLSHDSLNKVIDACKRMGRVVHLSKNELYGDTLGNKTYIEMMQSNSYLINKDLGGNEAGCGCY